MAELQKLKIAYRANSQIPLLFLIREKKLYEKYGIEPDIIQIKKNQEAQAALLGGKIEVLFGNHVLPYVARARDGAPIIYLAQTVNLSAESLITSPDIKDIKGLKGKRLGVSGIGHHPEITNRLCLKNAGIDVDKDRIERVELGSDNDVMLNMILEKKIDAAFIHPPFDLKARRKGLNVIEIPRLNMIWGVTVTTLSSVAERRMDAVTNLLKAIIAGIHFFKTNKEETIDVLNRFVGPALNIKDDMELVEHLYNQIGSIFEKRPYPRLESIINVFSLALMDYPDIKDLNPISMWNLHYLRLIDESGFIDELYSVN